MMNRRILPALAVGAVALAGYGGYRWRARATSGGAATVVAPQRARDARPSPDRGLACRFEIGDQAAFTLRFVVDSMDSGLPSEVSTLTSVLTWRVLERHAEEKGWLLAAALSSVDLRQRVLVVGANDTLDTPFLLTVGEDCRFTGMGFHASWSPLTRQFAASVLRSIELVVAPGSQAWEAIQTDGVGRYRALYAAVLGEDGEVEVTRRKAAYLAAESTGGMSVQPVAVESHAEGTFDRDGRWFRAVEARDHTRIKAMGQVRSDLLLRVSVARADARANLPWPPAPTYRFDADRYLWNEPTVEPGARIPATPDPRLAKLSLAEALSEFVIAYSSGKKDPYAAAMGLSAWLRARPDEAMPLIQAIKSGRIAMDMRPAAFLALEQCGSPQSAAALTVALSDDRMIPMDRARAASALSDVPRPTRENVAALMQQSRDPVDPGKADARTVSGTSVRALGHMAERVAKQDPTLEKEIRSELKRELGSSPDQQRTLDVLDAIGNSGDADFTGDLKEALTDGSPTVRERAARAFRRMEPDVAVASLTDDLKTEGDPVVKRAIAETLTTLVGKKGPGDDLIALAAAQLPAERDRRARAALINLLGPAARTSSVARDALVSQFHRETAPELLQLIGRYVTVDDLR